MSKIVDQTSDPGFATLRVVVERFPELRTLAKHANLDPSEFNDLPAESFAWPGQRRFPIHNAEHAALSIGYSKLAHILPSDVQSMLEKASSLYQIDETVFSPSTEIQKVASDQYLLPEKRRYRVTCSQDVKEAESLYHEKYAQLTIEDRAEAGYRLVKFAEQYEVTLNPSTQKLAGFTMTSTRMFRDWIEARREASIKLGSSISQAYDTLAGKFKDVEPLLTDRPSQLKLAQLVSDLDKQAGLTQYYGKKLPDPIQTVFNTPHLSRDFLKISSALQNKALLQSLPMSFWEDTLGADVVKEIAPNGTLDITLLEQLLPTLPADLKRTLETQLAAYNR